MSEELQSEVHEKEEALPEPPEKKRRKPTKKQVLHEIVSWLLMTVGTVLVAAGVYFFKAPNHFATGGVSGISIVLAKFVPLNQSTLVLIINAALLLLGFIFLGKGCTIRTLYCSLMYSLENFLFEQFLPLDIIPGTVKQFDEILYRAR